MNFIHLYEIEQRNFLNFSGVGRGLQEEILGVI
jgi:hypothetical protein